MADGFSNPTKRKVSDFHEWFMYNRLTVCVDASEQVLLEVKLVESRDDSDGLGRLDGKLVVAGVEC